MRSIIYISLLVALSPLFAQYTCNTTGNYSSNGLHWAGFAAPPANADVTIQGGICTILSGENIVINNLTINTGATLRVQGTASLRIQGTFLHNGILQTTGLPSNVEIVGDLSGSGQLDIGNTGSKINIGGANNNSFFGTATNLTGSTFIYNRFGNQSMLKIDYAKLILSGTGIKQLGTGSPRTVNDSLIIHTGTTFDFQTSVMSYGHLHNNGTITGISSYSFFGSVNQVISGSGVFNFSTFYVSKTIPASVSHNSASTIRVTSQLNLNSGVVKLQSGDLELASTGTFNGTYNSTSMIETNVGKLIREATTGSQLIMQYPVGVGGEYHPVMISSCNASGTGGLVIRIGAASCINCVNNFVDFGTTNSLIVSDIGFRMEFLAADKIGNPNKVFKNTTLANPPDTNTVSIPYYYGYNGNVLSVGGVTGNWKFLSLAPSVSRVERRQNPGVAVSSVCSGEPYIIVGNNFGGITGFDFNGTAVTDYVVSATFDTLFVHSMPTSGGGSFTLTNAQGSANVPFNVQPSPNTAVLYSPPATACSGSGVTFNFMAESFTDYQIILNGVLSSAQVSSTSPASYPITIPGVEMIVPGTYNISFRMTKGLCIDTSTPPKTVTVVPGPSLVSTSFPLAVSKCATNISFAPDISNFDFVNWMTTSTGFFSSTTTVNTTYIPSAIDLLNGYVSIILEIGKTGCPNITDTAVVSIVNAPTATLVGGSDTLCEDGSFLFTVNLKGLPPFNGLMLSPDIAADINLPSTTDTVITQLVTTSGTTPVNYSLAEQATFFVDQTGCRGTVTGIKKLHFEAKPTANLVFADTSMCEGGSVNVDLAVTGKFPVNITIGDGANVYSGTALTGSLQIPVSPLASGIYTVTAISTARCAAGTSSGATQVTVKANADQNTTLTQNADTLCDGQSVLLGINSENGIIYQASVAGTDIGTPVTGTGSIVSITIPYASPGLTTGSNQLLIKATGCITDTLNQNFMIQKSGLVASFNLSKPNGTQLCGASPVVLSTSLTASTMYWKVNGVEIINAGANSYTALVPGAYQCILQDIFQCKATSDTVMVNYLSVQPTVSVNVVSGYETVLTCSGGSNFAWYASVNGGLKKILNETTSQYTAYFDGTYYGSITQNGCIVFSEPVDITGKIGGALLRQNLVMSDSTITIPGLKWNEPVSVYPNPVSEGNSVVIEFLNTRGASVTAELYSSDGNLLRRETAEGQGMIHLNLATRGIKPGIYFLKLDDGLKTVGSNLMID